MRAPFDREPGGQAAPLEPLLGGALFQDELHHHLVPETAGPLPPAHADAELDKHLSTVQVGAQRAQPLRRMSPMRPDMDEKYRR